MATLEDLRSKKPEELIAMVLAAQADKVSNGLKVSAKGAVSLYGIRRFPVTYYMSEWKAIFAKVDAIKAFIEANKDQLAVKAPKE